jgi:hypothetical protein
MPKSPAQCLGRSNGLQGRCLRARCDLILMQDRQHPVLAVQFELLQAFPFDFLRTRHEPQIIICRELLLILGVFLKQATKLGIVSLNLLNE